MALTALLAAGVLAAPSERIFGMEIVGRHHDPFTVIALFGRPLGIYAQPVTDGLGTLLARVFDPVMAYNWLVLLSFPLSAVTALWLARHLGLSPLASAIAALAYAFAPFHIAQSAYHPHIAQTQWIPLYLLALWRSLDAASPLAVLFLVVAAAGVTLSNYYAGMIMAAVTPIAGAAYWLAGRRSGKPALRPLVITTASLLVVVTAAAGYAWVFAREVVVNREAFAFPREDLLRYGARWWSYFIPPVAHPWLGEFSRRVWAEAGLSVGLLEQQVSLGWGVIALSGVAVVGWLKNDGRLRSRAYVPVLVVVAAAAVTYSLAPERSIGSFTLVGPSALAHQALPMFRSYARFGIVVQLMAVLLAGIGIDRLRHAEAWSTRALCWALVASIAFEYTVSPRSMWRDVLPTEAHRWVVDQQRQVRALDCTPDSAESASVEWLTSYRVVLMNRAIGDCFEPDLAQRLSIGGFTHLLVRDGRLDALITDDHHRRAGWDIETRFSKATLFIIPRRVPPVYTAGLTGFSPREHDAEWSWRWMGSDAAWTIVGTANRTFDADLTLELAAFRSPRRLAVQFDSRPAETVLVNPDRETYRITVPGVTPGAHQIRFHSESAPTVADAETPNGDRRPLSFAIGAWRWTEGQ